MQAEKRATILLIFPSLECVATYFDSQNFLAITVFFYYIDYSTRTIEESHFNIIHFFCFLSRLIVLF